MNRYRLVKVVKMPGRSQKTSFRIRDSQVKTLPIDC
jgi:hypothetical protein